MSQIKVGQVVSVDFRTDGNGKRVKTSPEQYEVDAIYTDKDQHGNPKVKLNNGDVFYITLTDKGWRAIL